MPRKNLRVAGHPVQVLQGGTVPVSSILIRPTPVQEYICTKGHSWKSATMDTIHISLGYMGQTPGGGPYCMRCVIDLMDQFAGKVEQIPSVWRDRK